MYYRMIKIPAVFVRCGYEVQIYHDDGEKAYRRVDVCDAYHRRIGRTFINDPMRFFGDDGRKVRAEAIAWAKAQGVTEQRTG